MQRDRSYEAFQDDEQRFERRPSLWIEPLGDWGQGSVQLLEIPSDAEINDNILAYWRPKAPMAAGTRSGFGLPAILVLDAARAAAARRSSPRPGSAAASVGRRRRFFVDFTGDMLGRARSCGSEARADRWSRVDPQPSKLWPYPERKMVRVAFELDPGNENACEMRLDPRSRRKADQRNMALSLDTISRADANVTAFQRASAPTCRRNARLDDADPVAAALVDGRGAKAGRRPSRTRPRGSHGCSCLAARSR